MKQYKCGNNCQKTHLTQAQADKCRTKRRNKERKERRVKARRIFESEKKLKNKITRESLLSNFIVDRELALLQSQYSSIEIVSCLSSKLNVQENMVIVPILEKEHWYFVIWNRQKNEITICDSKLGFAPHENLYKKFLCHTIKIDLSFPQQENRYDCGVFMLLGIEEFLKSQKKNEIKWSMDFKKCLQWRLEKMKNQ